MIKVCLSRSELLTHSPCEEGIAFFDLLAPTGSIEIVWTPLHSIMLCLPQFQKDRFGPWLVEKGLIPAPNLRGASLSEADLRGANFYRASLSEADLRGADLSGANLYGANFRGADLRGANLRGASLYGADLFGAARFSSDPEISGWKIEWERLIWS